MLMISTRLSDKGRWSYPGLKKNYTLNHKEKVALIEENTALSKKRQAELLGISRTSIYRKHEEKDEDDIMKKIDEIYTARPFYGNRRIREDLKDYDIYIGRKRLRRLMQTMGLKPIYPGPNTSKSNSEHTKYPYLLKDLKITHPNHVWGTDITYIRLHSGFVYLSAMLDWYSRYVVAWRLSDSLETELCTNTLTDAYTVAIPDIHNSDQGVQYTSKEYIDTLKTKNIQISMDGKGRCMDNIFTERLWRTVKYENIFLHDYQSLGDVQKGLAEYFEFYNTKRKHQSLDYKTPEQVYLNH